MKTFKKLLSIAPLLLCAYAGSSQALVINFIPAPNMDPTALAGFQSAANRWTNVLHDNVQVNLNIGFNPLPAGVLGSTGAVREVTSYSATRNAMAADAWGRTDNTAVANLSTSNCLDILMNGTGVNPAGVGNAATFVDANCNANNATIRMTRANMRALGLVAAKDNVLDGTINFSSNFAWDFNPDDGISSNLYDFIGVATHEIGHALGFISGVDILDGNRSRNFSDAAFTWVAPADLFRCSDDSVAAGADIDWSADNRDKYFSLDNCAERIAMFSNGRTFGDGQQASHWKDSLGLGILDPTAGRGELLSISQLDLQLFDAIGWNVVPEPGTIGMTLLGLAGLASARRRRRAA
ncbi:MAG: NF038122 family metalloprotease [Telluria sp.]